MQLTNRRQLLAGIGATFLAMPGRARAERPAPFLPELARWQTGNAVLSPPTFDAGRLFFCGSDTGGQFDPAAQVPVWLRPHGLGGPAAFRPRLAEGAMLIGGRQGYVCFDPDTGTERWRYTARIQTGVPVLAAGRAVFGDGHEIVALDLATGAELWRFAGVPDTIAAYAPAVAGDAVFAGPGDGRLYALSLADGALRWQIDGRARWQYLRQIHFGAGVLVAGSYKEQLFAISPENGTIRWEFIAGNFINSHHVAGDLACLWSPTGRIFAIDIGNGLPRWQYQTTDYRAGGDDWASVLAELTSAEGQLFTLDMRDTLRLLDLADGSLGVVGKVPGATRHAVLPLGAGRVAFPMMDGSLLMTGLG
ncbi:MAG: PQQ-like beta-propeller repeat protein [Phaeovulum sp.]|uniref:PQQ-binding-like beta-propeller repeat protein n=1 Tax=Phaeovulum sp. TaxID=2934796 RepID=UPI00272FF2FD|nr:PQQ-binding-like beta-propeller repeat protein [Phaeovulum sp.]MDP2061609.1 PQQ-like beta-propeller repeat protein [Phaeovulum sp.]